jgi:hypothetical protein
VLLLLLSTVLLPSVLLLSTWLSVLVLLTHATTRQIVQGFNGQIDVSRGREVLSSQNALGISHCLEVIVDGSGRGRSSSW